ncbi:hypothetical protein Q8W87_05355 [Pseudomonas aeruginosa]|uniref:hypothetical protein n=1 Tax=Pseudomonas aeruginosa TaxID=287 RepID=UPI0028FEC1F5|nr:hypothetical protein [Pseudomonas aeruginosa]MDU0699506.1 hypothetical protein [Pseudomonas aeruginosa]
MSDVTRYTFDTTACWYEHPDGEFVEHNAYAKLAAEAQALREEVAKLRASVVVPDGYALVPIEPTVAMRMPWKTMRGHSWYSKYKAMLEAAPRLNGKTVSEGLLRRLCEPLLSHADYVVARNELRALLDAGKEDDRDEA